MQDVILPEKGEKFPCSSLEIRSIWFGSSLVVGSFMFNGATNLTARTFWGRLFYWNVLTRWIINLDDHYGNLSPIRQSVTYCWKVSFRPFIGWNQTNCGIFMLVAVWLYIIHSNGVLNEICLGQNLDNNEIFQRVIESGCWFTAIVNDPRSYSLIGCIVFQALITAIGN